MNDAQAHADDVIRVNDPVLRWLVAVVGAIACWALVQVQRDSTTIQVLSQRITAIEQNVSSSLSRLEYDIREIRKIVESRNTQ